jgi:uncharacterized membrane protein YciS (DUF1049 family)
MKIIRAILVLVLFIAAVLLASANEAAVTIVYLPELPLAGFERARSVLVPLFLVVLVSLGLGGILGGGLALFQQAALKLRVRRLDKDNARLTNDVAAAREKLGLVTAQLDQSRQEAALLRTELEGPHESAAEVEAAIDADAGRPEQDGRSDKAPPAEPPTQSTTGGEAGRGVEDPARSATVPVDGPASARNPGESGTAATAPQEDSGSER